MHYRKVSDEDDEDDWEEEGQKEKEKIEDDRSKSSRLCIECKFINSQFKF